MNEGQEAFRRFARQIRVAGGGSQGRFPGGPGGGLFAGSGLLVALVAGGFALNAALFNGKSSLPFDSILHILFGIAQWTVVIEPSSTAGTVVAFMDQRFS